MERCWLVPLMNARAMPIEEMEAKALAAGMHPVSASQENALAEAKAWAREKDGVVCIAGSVYPAGEVLERERSDQ